MPADTLDLTAARQPSPAVEKRGPGPRAARWLVPSLGDCFWAALLFWLLANPGPAALLADGDVGWHIRTGEYILEHWSVPRTDLFTFTRPDAPWFAWEWLADVLLALMHRWMGLKGVVLLAVAILAAWPVVTLRHALWRGANAWMAVLFTLLALGAASVHYLARPHVFTLLFAALAVWLIEQDRRRPGIRVWCLLPLTLLWANLHGGFGLAVALAALTSAGAAAEALWGRGEWSQARRYAGLAAGCAAISLVNPYGVQLHSHILAYLRSDWIARAVDEFKAPDFRSEGLLQFELMLVLALVLTGTLLARRRFVHALWILVFAHLALTSVRHVPVFLIVAAPIVAELATGVWSQVVSQEGGRSVTAILERIGRDLAPGFQRHSIWPAAVMAVVMSPGLFMVDWPRDFPGANFPVEMVRAHGAALRTGRVLTIDQWANYLIYAHYPRQRVFGDGRSDFLGPELGEEWIRAMQAQSGWEKTLERFKVDVVLAPGSAPLGAVLRITPGWQVLAEDGQAILFTR